MPVVAAVHGNCFGGGFEIALRADVIVAAESARFCHTEACDRRCSPCWVECSGSPNGAGRSRAARWALTSQKVSAADALAAGVVTEVVADGELDAVTASWASRFARGATRGPCGRTRRCYRPGPTVGCKPPTTSSPHWPRHCCGPADAQYGVASAVKSDEAGIAASGPRILRALRCTEE